VKPWLHVADALYFGPLLRTALPQTDSRLHCPVIVVPQIPPVWQVTQGEPASAAPMGQVAVQIAPMAAPAQVVDQLPPPDKVRVGRPGQVVGGGAARARTCTKAMVPQDHGDNLALSGPYQAMGSGIQRKL
jgi:hypothetical protein